MSVRAYLFVCLAVLGEPVSFAAPSEMRMAVAQEYTTLNPVLAASAVDSYLSALVYRADLVYRDGSQTWKALAAERIPSLENGDVKLVGDGAAKKMKVVWRLHPDARWGDGTPLLAEDYRFAWEVARHPNVAAAVERAGLDAVEKFEIDAKNPRVFSLTYTKARFDYLKVAPQALPRHLEEEIFRKNADVKEGYDRNSVYQTTPSNPGLYCGPWLVKEVKPGSHIILTRNERYWGKKSKLDQLVIRFLENTHAVEASLLAGEVHLANSMGIGLDQALSIEKRSPANLRVEWLPGAVYEHIVLPVDHSILSDVRVRRAIAHAVDRESLVRSVFSGKFPVAHQFLTPRDPWFPKTGVAQYPFSVRKAAALLDEAGWKPGPDGVRTKDGKRLALQYTTTSGNKLRETVQVFVQGALKAVGIEVNIRNVPSRVLFGDVLPHRSFEGMAMFARDDYSETSPREFLHSGSVPTKENGFSGGNYAGWKNPKVDAWIGELEEELVLEQRKTVARKIAAEYASELPALPLYFRGGAVILARDVMGFVPALGPYGSEDWSLAPASKKSR